MKTKEKKIILLVMFIFGICFLLYFVSINSKFSKFKVEDRTRNISELKQREEDVVGWLRVEGTNIDLPLISDMDTINIPSRYYDYAWVYARPGSDSNHVSFISHNVRNVSRKPIVGDNTMTGFEQLMSFIYPDFVSKNQYIAYTNVENETTLYKIYAVALTVNDQSASFKVNYTSDEQTSYIDKAKTDSMYDIDVDVNSSDKLISLMTCTRFYGGVDYYTFRVDARELRNNEKQELAKVTTNKNYKKIYNRMKEGAPNEKI